MGSLINVGYVVNAVLFSFIGMAILGIGFIFFDKLTPYKLWDELIKQKNVALAIVVAGLTIGIAIIISSAIH